MTLKEQSDTLFNEAEKVFFTGRVSEAVEMVNKSNSLSAEHFGMSNFHKANTKRMIAAYNTSLPALKYVSDNDTLIRLLLMWIGLNSIKPKYQLLDVLPGVPIEWPEWDRDILPMLSKRVQVEKRMAVDLLCYLNAYTYRQYVLQDIAERNDPSLIALITDINGQNNAAIVANSVRPEDLPPFTLTSSGYVTFVREERLASNYESAYGKLRR
ncbi:hypothetical protein [Paenibacillus sp. NPDC057967]|uniref:hypothetical protein n=1 Tax=Paenibacillus sp. NPDC057967 TaxID=3346293 RepID=UPI0036D904E8